MHHYPRTPRRLTRFAALATLLAALLAGLFLTPAPALAAPALTLAPAAIPPGGTVTVAGTGFTPGAKLELFVAIPQFHDARVKMADLTASAAGGVTATIREPGFAQPERITVVVTGGGADLARAVYTITDAPSIAPERLTITPGTGPVGTRFTASGTGLTPGLVVKAFTTESALGPQGHFRQVAQLTVPADGRTTFPIDTTGYDPAGYDLVIFGPDGPAIGLPLVIAQFAVTAPGASTPAADPAAVYRRFIDARNRYDLDATLALLTDDFQFVGGPDCTEGHPCVGKEAFRMDQQGFIAAHAQITIVGMPQVSGTTVRARLEIRADNSRAAGVERIVTLAKTEVRDGKIASTSSVPDASDPQTAQFLDYQRTHQPPAPGPMPGLPNTGGGGLAAGADRRGDLALGLLTLVVGLVGRGIRARRPGR